MLAHEVCIYLRVTGSADSVRKNPERAGTRRRSQNRVEAACGRRRHRASSRPRSAIRRQPAEIGPCFASFGQNRSRNRSVFPNMDGRHGRGSHDRAGARSSRFAAPARTSWVSRSGSRLYSTCCRDRQPRLRFAETRRTDLGHHARLLVPMARAYQQKNVSRARRVRTGHMKSPSNFWRR